MKELRQALIDSQNEYEDILTKIKVSNPAYAEMVTARPVSLSSLNESLDSTTAVIAYWLSKNQLISWLIKNGTIIPKSTDIEESAVTLLVENSRRAIRSNSQDESSLNLKLLNKILFQPYEKELSGFKNLVVIPNGALHFLPFQALMNDDGRYLVEKYNLVYAPSASVFVICNSRKAVPGSRFMGVAISELELENRQPLPGTEEEVKKIEPLFSEHLTAIGKESTESFVKKNSPDYNFIHFATHGNYNYEQPLYSHLLFPAGDDDDGRLNVYEVFEMSLNASLVTLSACETGLGNISQGDELVGLSRAFLFAGSSSVVVSLWSVADYPTSLLMTNFYNYMKSYPVQEALTLAQRDVLKLYPQPQYWSPFILIGNGNIISE
jgi:CHAT domain-containing protein